MPEGCSQGASCLGCSSLISKDTQDALRLGVSLSGWGAQQRVDYCCARAGAKENAHQQSQSWAARSLRLCRWCRDQSTTRTSAAQSPPGSTGQWVCRQPRIVRVICALPRLRHTDITWQHVQSTTIQLPTFPLQRHPSFQLPQDLTAIQHIDSGRRLWSRP